MAESAFLGCPTSRRLAACSPLGLLAVTLALPSGGFQLAVAFRVDLLMTPGQHVLRRDVAGGAVQADVVVSSRLAAAHLPATAAFPAECTRFCGALAGCGKRLFPTQQSPSG
jgi:hypothetical protein